MKRLLVIRSNKESSWGSCKVISPNLQECYRRLKGSTCDVRFFEIDKDFLREDALRDDIFIISLASEIKDFDPTELVFVDHVPHVVDLLNFLSIYIPIKDMPPFVFHVYGDFTFYSQSWSNISESLKGHSVKFIVASEAQEKMIKSFSNKDTCVERFLFPVDETEYYYDHDERVSTRQEAGVKDYEVVILYAGRISLQKNVEKLIKEYSEIFSTSTFPTKLWIVGAFDDFGAPFQGVLNHEGYMFSKIDQVINSLPENVAASIKFWGHQPKQVIRELNNASDMFMSLSLYHDEDFGMSPAEALACGVPTLLTDWGGYSSFVSKRWFCNLLPIKLTPFGHELMVSRVLDFYNLYSLSYINKIDRKRWSDEFLKEFSISAGTEKLKKIIEKDFEKFQGFNWSLEHFARVYWSVSHGKEINVHLTPSDDNIYFHVYKNYISGKET